MIGAEVVDVENEFFREVFRGTPDNPADTGVDLRSWSAWRSMVLWTGGTYQAVFVSRNIDGDDFFETEVPD